MKPKTFANIYIQSKLAKAGTSPVVQWLRLHTFNERDTGLIPGPGTKIPRVVWAECNINLNEKDKFRRSRPDMSIIKIGN